MAFMFHHIWDVIHQPLTNSYFSRWLKPPVFVFIHRVCTIIVLLYTIVHYCTLYIHCTYSTSLFVWVKARHVHGCWLCVMCVSLKSGYAIIYPLLTHHLSCQTGHVCGQIPMSDGSIPIENSI